MPLARSGARRHLVRLTAATVVVASAVALDGQSVRADGTPEAYSVLASLQADRLWVHAAPLQVDGALSQAALAHSEEMARVGTIFHTASLYSLAALVPNWERVGENVGMGPTWQSVETAFEHSPEHLANMLGAYDLIGIGVVDSGTEVFVTEEFAEAPG
jgi:uncharacterized protein YkwD